MELVFITISLVLRFALADLCSVLDSFGITALMIPDTSHTLLQVLLLYNVTCAANTLDLLFGTTCDVVGC